MTATRIQVTVDCHDPALLTRFWAAALGYVQPALPAGFARWSDYWRSLGVPEEEVDDTAGAVVDPEGVGPRVFFQPVPEAKTVKNRVHLDLDVTAGRSEPLDRRRTAVEAEAARHVGLGACRLATNALGDHYSVTMADPEGNEYCLR